MAPPTSVFLRNVFLTFAGQSSPQRKIRSCKTAMSSVRLDSYRAAYAHPSDHLSCRKAIVLHDVAPDARPSSAKSGLARNGSAIG